MERFLCEEKDGYPLFAKLKAKDVAILPRADEKLAFYIEPAAAAAPLERSQADEGS